MKRRPPKRRAAATPLAVAEPATQALAVAAVLLHSRRPAPLARFYRDVVGVPLRPFAGPKVPLHHACEVGGVYVAVMGASASRQARRTCLAVMVPDVKAAARALKARGVRQLEPPRRTALGLIARFLDPEGNPFELYQP